MADVQTPEEATTAVLLVLDTLTEFNTEALKGYNDLTVEVPSNLSALPDAVAKVGMALHNLRDVLVVCRDVVTRGNPIGYGLQAPVVVEPPPAPLDAPEEL